MLRRDFIAGLGGAVLWPAVARLQPAELPLIGFLHEASAESYAANAAAFAEGLKQGGFAEARDLAVDYRFAGGDTEQLATAAADLVRSKVALIVAGGSRAALAARAATDTIPIVFVIGDDPVKLGLAESIARPGTNATGATFATAALMARKLALLGELVPGLARIGLLAEDAGEGAAQPALAEATTRLSTEFRAAASARGWQPIIVTAGRGHAEYDAAFATLEEGRADAVVVAPTSAHAMDAEEIASWAARHDLPAMFQSREDVVLGGLMSFGARQPDAWRQAGVHTGGILKGGIAAQTPIVATTTTELVLGRAAARAIGLTWPPGLLAAADEVIE